MKAHHWLAVGTVFSLGIIAVALVHEEYAYEAARNSPEAYPDRPPPGYALERRGERWRPVQADPSLRWLDGVPLLWLQGDGTRVEALRRAWDQWEFERRPAGPDEWRREETEPVRARRVTDRLAPVTTRWLGQPVYGVPGSSTPIAVTHELRLEDGVEIGLRSDGMLVWQVKGDK